MRKIFLPGKAVDFNQDVVIQVLNNEYKDGAGKYPDSDFNRRKYLLQDADMNYWSIELSVKKVEKEDFLTDIRCSMFQDGLPKWTYILSYVTVSADGRHERHAVYAESVDHTRVNYINSWGRIDPTPRVPIDAPGNIFYRVFAFTYIVLSTSSSGPSAKWRVLGVFEYIQQHNNSPAYRQRHTLGTTVTIKPQYLYRMAGYRGNC